MLWAVSWVHIPLISLLGHPELQLPHLQSSFREDDCRPVCEALGGDGAWLRSQTLCCVPSGKALNLSEPFLISRVSIIIGVILQFIVWAKTLS